MKSWEKICCHKILPKTSHSLMSKSAFTNESSNKVLETLNHENIPALFMYIHTCWCCGTRVCVGLAAAECAAWGCECLWLSRNSWEAQRPTGKTYRPENSENKRKEFCYWSPFKDLNIERRLQHHLSLTHYILFFTDLQHRVQHVDLAGLVSGLRQSKALWRSHPRYPLDHSLHPGELHQHILVLRTQPAHTQCVVNCFTQHLWGTWQITCYARQPISKSRILVLHLLNPKSNVWSKSIHSKEHWTTYY